MKRVKKNTNKISLKEKIDNGIHKIKIAKMHIALKHYDKVEARAMKSYEKYCKKFNEAVDKVHECIDKVIPTTEEKKSKIPVVDPKYAGPVPVKNDKNDKVVPFTFTVNGTNYDPNNAKGVIRDPGDVPKTPVFDPNNPYANWSPAGKMIVENMRKVYEKNYGNKENKNEGK